VISIIALLIAILLPALSAAREAGRNAGCLSNLRQIGLGVASYATDRGVIPPSERKPNGSSWTHTWGTEMMVDGQIDAPRLPGQFDLPTAGSVFQCPSGGSEVDWAAPADFNDPEGGDAVPMIGTDPDGTTFYSPSWYAGNGHHRAGVHTTGHPLGALYPGDRNNAVIDRVANASTLVAFYDGFYYHNRNTSTWFQGFDRSVNARHGDRTNLVFFDAHAASETTADLATIDPDDMTAPIALRAW